jgi:hypothetical protein
MHLHVKHLLDGGRSWTIDDAPHFDDGSDPIDLELRTANESLRKSAAPHDKNNAHTRRSHKHVSTDVFMGCGRWLWAGA